MGVARGRGQTTLNPWQPLRKIHPPEKIFKINLQYFLGNDPLKNPGDAYDLVLRQGSKFHIIFLIQQSIMMPNIYRFSEDAGGVIGETHFIFYIKEFEMVPGWNT
jgi:hypothetical protein